MLTKITFEMLDLTSSLADLPVTLRDLGPVSREIMISTSAPGQKNEAVLDSSTPSAHVVFLVLFGVKSSCQYLQSAAQPS